jgi:hypothetical protein
MSADSLLPTPLLIATRGRNLSARTYALLMEEFRSILRVLLALLAEEQQKYEVTKAVLGGFGETRCDKNVPVFS